MSLLTTHQAYPPLQASRWLTCSVLLEVQEMEALIQTLDSFWVFPIGGVSRRGEEIFSKSRFLEAYSTYIQALKQGQISQVSALRKDLSAAWTRTLEAVYALLVGETQQIIRIWRPVVQLQMHHFSYSSLDGKFRSMMKGADQIEWGIQFSYPQLYQTEEMQVKKVLEGDEFPNTVLFKQLQRWIRYNTMVTPFWIAAEERKVNVPIRIGQGCLEWINQHPQLVERGLRIDLKTQDSG